MRAFAILTIAAASLSTVAASSWKHLLNTQTSSSSTGQLSLDDTPVTAWSVHTLEQFPHHSLRVKEESRLCDPNVKQYVGYVDIEGQNDDLSEAKHFFFWFFESRRNPATDPLVLWLNGGPGCSSMTGLLMELGPCQVAPGGQNTTINKFSWNNEANLLFLDQPVNTGFSYSGGEQVATTADAADDTYAFLQLFLSKYNKYDSLDFHITGESYAGHYLPAIATKLLVENAAVKKQKKHNKNLEIAFAGMAIGNGKTDPVGQSEYYADMAADTKYGPVLSEEEIAVMRSKWPNCKNLGEACYKWETPFTCIPGEIYCNNAMLGPFQKTGLNVYDVRMKCDSCYEIFNDMDVYLNKPEVQKILNVDRKFESCNMEVNKKFTHNGDYMRPIHHQIPAILEAGIEVLIYAGDADFICNWYGNKAWTMQVEWEGAEGFRNATDTLWTSKITGQPAGEIRHYKNFSFLKVYESGHLVPYDQPEHASEMINSFLKNAARKNKKQI
ncbi:hypothetical protein HKX48_000715 [Thoreauomyces humboldtii]|nr:hypothetical protein HKX48_000715 [Thoreauomyces humboldtii]